MYNGLPGTPIPSPKATEGKSSVAESPGPLSSPADVLPLFGQLLPAEAADADGVRVVGPEAAVYVPLPLAHQQRGLLDPMAPQTRCLPAGRHGLLALVILATRPLAGPQDLFHRMANRLPLTR